MTARQMAGLLAAILVALILGGCGAPPVPLDDGSPSGTEAPARGPGVNYLVSAGETLRGVARAYGVDVSDLARANGLSETSPLRAGQALFIPNRAEAPSPAPAVSRQELSGSAPIEKIEVGRVSAAGYQWPLDGRVTMRYDQFTATGRSRGVFVAASAGSPVRAAKAGTVSFVSDSLRGYGRTIMINHGGGVLSVYAECSEILARQGEPVVRGQVIARAGGGLAGHGSGIQFRIYRHGEPVDPLPLLP